MAAWRRASRLHGPNTTIGLIMTLIDPAAADDMLLAVLASKAAGGARRAADLILRRGRGALRRAVFDLDSAEIESAEQTVNDLMARDIRALVCDEQAYPAQLRDYGSFPPVLFCQGPVELLHAPAIGVCGSRRAGHEGLQAATACAEEAVRSGRVVVSGYAKGIDTASHVAALRAGGATVAVLAEGITKFRLKQPFPQLSPEQRGRMLVVSQFAPNQPWNAGAATTRNNLIIGLSEALVVVEASAKSGTLRAGQAALHRKRPVWALTFAGGESPEGNQILLSSGAEAVPDRFALANKLAAQRPESGQLGLAI